jgi:hypothetical protein
LGRTFNCAIEFVAVINGMDYDYCKRSTVNANEFARANMKESLQVCHGAILVCKMLQFYGCLQKMSVDHHQVGGYLSCFTDPTSVNLSRNDLALLKDYPNCALSSLSQQRSKQIMAAFIPRLDVLLLATNATSSDMPSTH